MEKFSFIIAEDLNHHRLDVVLAKLLPAYSRSQLSQWIKEGKVMIPSLSQDKISPKLHVQSGQYIELSIPHQEKVRDKPQAMALDIVHEDEAILVINKPAGLTVHPGAGQGDHTLLNALLYYDKDLANVPRAGIVHRLDKLTSGLMVIAKTLVAQTDLVRQLQERTVSRRYLALVNNVPITGFYCDKAIGRHPTQRTKMAALEQGGKSAYTEFRILKKYRKHALLEATLSTGRTHQIRVHLSDRGYPIMGDRLYGKRLLLAKNMNTALIRQLQQLKRQALHAHYLRLKHPLCEEVMAFDSVLPEALQLIVDGLEADKLIQGS